MAKKYDPIKTPFSQRLREFRVRAVPLLVFFVVAGVVAYLWQERVYSPGFMGMVVADRANVSSPADGIVDQLFIGTFEEVRKGNPIARIIRADSSYVQARLDLVRLRVEQMEVGFGPIQNLHRNMLDYESLKLEKVQKRLEFTSLNLEKNLRASEYNRALEIYENGGISQEEFQRIETRFLLLESEVNRTEELILQLEESIAKFAPYIASDDFQSPLLTAIRAQEQELAVIEEEMKPVTIYTPIDGVISHQYKHNGEFVRAGERLIDIQSKEPAYIIGFVRQPLQVIPEPGMEVQVRTRKPNREMFNSQIVRVSGQINLIDSNLQRPGSFEETGLPVQIAINQSEGTRLVPGEIVDLVIFP